MANSKNFGTSNDKIVYWIEYWTNSQNIANNTSNITAKVWVKRTNTGYTTYGSGTVNLSINGTNYSQAITSSQKITSSQICLIEKTVNISHNSDGTKKIRIEASISHSQFSSGTNGLDYTLSTIARKSSVTCADGNIGSATTININRASSSFKHTLKYTFGSLTGTIATKTTNTSVGWTIPTTFYAQIPNATNGTGAITCETYSGDTLIGSSTCSFHAFVINSNPSISATVVDTNATTVALTGDANKLVKYYSNAKVTMSATAKNNATIKSQKVVCGAKSGTSATSTLNNIESGTFNISCTDSRGLTASNTITKTLINYIRLAFTQITLARPNTTSNTINATVKGNYFNASFGAVANALTLKWRWRIKNGSWSSYATVTATKNGNTFTYSATLGTAFSFSNEYEFEFVAVDKLATISSTKAVTRGLPIVDIGKDDVRVNGTAYANEFFGCVQSGVRTEDFASNYLLSHSFAGSINNSNLWRSLINIRHRGGTGDGNVYGLQIMDPNMTSSLQELQVRKQINGSWTKWDQIPIRRNLYNNTSGTTGTVTLNESVANFRLIKIYYKSNDGFCSYVEVYSPDGKSAWLANGWIDTNLYGNQKFKTVRISGTTITTLNYVEANIGSNVTSANNNIYITQVDGYR